MKIGDRRVVLLAGLPLLLLAGLALTVSSGPLVPDGGVPPVVSYQGVLTDGYGDLLAGTFTMTFQLYDTADGIAALWRETQPVTVTDSLFGAYLGSTSALTDTLFDGRDLYLGVSVGTDGEMSPRMRVPAVPYAFTADRALSVPIPVRSAPLGDGAVTGRVGGWSALALQATRSLDAVGMESASYRTPWSVLAAGGMDMASSSYRMGSTLAQPLIGVAQSDSFMISAGYWPGARVLAERRYRVFLPLVLRGW